MKLDLLFSWGGGGRGGGVSYYLQTKLHFGKKIGRSALKSRSTKNRRI